MAALCADLVGSDICTAAGIIARSSAPVLALCRRLIQQAGYDPATLLQAYRGATLALTMRSLAEAAKFTVEECSDGRLRLRRYRPHPSEGPPLAPKSASALAEVHTIAWPTATVGALS